MHYGISTTPCLWKHVLTSTTPCLWKCIFGTNFLFNEFAKKKLQKKGWWDKEALNDGCTMGTNGK
jgi:CRISPR/Cas system endoribonuclease Cas6 (RAMP superfamily)